MPAINAYNKFKSLSKAKFSSKIRISSRSKVFNKATDNAEAIIRSTVKIIYNLSGDPVINIPVLSSLETVSSNQINEINIKTDNNILNRLI